MICVYCAYLRDLINMKDICYFQFKICVNLFIKRQHEATTTLLQKA